MTSIEYAVHAAAWTLVGIAIGAYGRAQFDARRNQREALMPEKQPTRRSDVPRVINILVVVLLVASAAQAWIFYERTSYIVSCLNAYAVGVGLALDARSSASASAQQALDRFLSKVGEVMAGRAAGGSEGRAQVEQALGDYLATRKAATAQQARNPYPPAPVDLCK